MMKRLFVILLSLIYICGIGLSQQQAILFAPNTFTPNQLSGLKLWLKAESLALNDGDAVGTWTDSSGNGDNASQVTTANKPTYKTNILHTYPVVRFNGTNSYMTMSSDAVSSGAFTFIAVVVLRGSPCSYCPVYISAQSNSGERVCLKTSGSNWGTYTGTDGNANSALSSVNTYLLTQNYNGTTTFFFKNGSADGSAGGTPHGSGNSSTLGAENQASRFSQIDIAEMILYNTALSTADRQTVEGYLNMKYAIY